MHIKNKVTTIIAAAMLIACMSSCGVPRSLDKVEMGLESSMKIGYRYTALKESKTSDGYAKNIYYFKDDNGVEFEVVAGVYNSQLGPYGTDPTSNYACALFDKQKDVALNAIHSDLPVELFERRDSDGILDSNGINITVSSFYDLENVPQIVENTITSLKPFPFYPINPSESNYISYSYPGIYINSSDASVILFYRFLDERSAENQNAQADNLTKMQERYLDMMRDGYIGREELPYDVWERFPARTIFIIYLNQENISREHHYYSYNKSTGTYMINTMEVFGKDGIITKYVSQIDGDYMVDDEIRTWTINGDVWLAVRSDNSAEKKDWEALRYHWDVTKNGEPFQLPDRQYTFEEFGDIFGFEITIDQEEPAIHILTP